jgi:hypothetical protein
MPIVDAELRSFKSQSVSDTAASNGGRLSANVVASGVNNNIFPDVPQAERLSGSLKYRKVFYKNENAANLPLYNANLFVENYTQGDDAVYMRLGTQTDLQSARTGAEKIYGCGKLDVTVAAGASSLNVLIEDATVQFFADGDTIRISDKATIDAGTGNEEYATISGAPSLAGSVATLALTAPLANGYNASAARVSNVYTHGDLQPAASALVATTLGNGTYDDVAAPIVLSNVGTVYDEWTVTFSTATAYAVSGVREGAIGTASTLGDFAPLNPANSSPLFTLPGAGFIGVWAAGDTLTFITSPAAVPLWVERRVPPNASAVAGNRFVIGLTGETA